MNYYVYRRGDGVDMGPPRELWIFAVFTLASAFTTLCYMVYKKRQTAQLIQGVVGVTGGVITLVSMFFPWVVVNGYDPRSSFDLGELFVPFIKTQFVSVVTMFLFLFAILTTLGGVMLMFGYEMGKKIVSYASGLALFLSIIIILGLGALPAADGTSITVEIYPWIFAFGTILGLVGVRLKRSSSGYQRTSSPIRPTPKPKPVSRKVKPAPKPGIRCTNCGHINPANFIYCGKCGAPLKEEETQVYE